MFKPPYREIAQFAGNLATCLEAGVGLEQGIQSSGRALSNTRFGNAIRDALDRVQKGNQLSDALAATKAPWPPFLVPFVKAGEQSGRLDHALRYLEEHCRMLDGPARAVQRVWLLPLSIVLGGTVVQILALFFLASPARAFWHFAAAVQGYATLALIVFFWVAPPFKPIVDPIKLALPGLGLLQREMASNRFFSGLAMLYESGGFRVESMIRMAAQSVQNLAVRRDYLVAAAEVEEGASIAEAFEKTTRLTADEKHTIRVGDLAGTLERSFTRNSELSGERLTRWLKVVEQISLRITMAIVTLAVIGTVQSIVWLWLR